MRQYAPELYNSQLDQFFSLKTLILEHCELEFFTPKGLSDLEVLSLEGNKIQDLKSIVFHPEDEQQQKDTKKSSSK